ISDAGLRATVAAFHDEHLRQYRYSHPDSPVETSALRVAARGTRVKPDVASAQSADGGVAFAERERRVHFGDAGWTTSRVVDRDALRPGDTVAGPAIIDQLDSTIVLPPDTTAVVDAVGNVIISIGKETA